jgi:hypothetical protein
LLTLADPADPANPSDPADPADHADHAVSILLGMDDEMDETRARFTGQLGTIAGVTPLQHHCNTTATPF